MQKVKFKWAATIALVSAISAVVGLSAFTNGHRTTDSTVEHNFVWGKKELPHSSVVADSVAIAALGEQAAKMFFSAKRATLYHLIPTEPVADSDETIGNVKVHAKIGTVCGEDLRILQFLLSDSNFYYTGDVVSTSPYAPNYAISVANRHDRIDLVFSLVSGEMAVVENGKAVRKLKYNDRRLVTRFFRNVAQNDFYDHIIENQ